MQDRLPVSCFPRILERMGVDLTASPLCFEGLLIMGLKYDPVVYSCLWCASHKDLRPGLSAVGLSLPRYSKPLHVALLAFSSAPLACSSLAAGCLCTGGSEILYRNPMIQVHS